MHHPAAMSTYLELRAERKQALAALSGMSAQQVHEVENQVESSPGVAVPDSKESEPVAFQSPGHRDLSTHGAPPLLSPTAQQASRRVGSRRGGRRASAVVPAAPLPPASAD